MNIFLAIDEFNAEQLARIRALAGDDTVSQRTDYSDNAEPDEAFRHSEVVFGNVPANWIEQSTVLSWAQLDSVGFGEYRAIDWSRPAQEVTLTNLAGFFADPVAETALAGILSLYRGVDQLVIARQQQQWLGDPLRARLQTLKNASVVLFGYGSINRRLEALLAPYDCRVTAFGKNWTATGSEESLDDALATADIVVCTAPETDTTVGVFDHRRLSLLKPKTLFVNCGRGSVVDESALAEQLNNGKLGGAVIDVTLDEPLPVEHPFWHTPNTLLTQHSGGGTEDEIDRKITVFANNLQRYRQGLSLENAVDFERGY